MTEWGAVPDGVWMAIRHYLEPYVGASFTVAGDPIPKKRRVGQGRHAFTPKRTVDGEKAVRASFREVMDGWEPEPDCTYGVLIEFRTLGGSKVDLDNATKLVWDALNEVFWQDDVQVGDSYLHLVRGRGEPGVEVMLFRVQDNGTPKTKLCACGRRYRAITKTCAECTRNRAAVRELLDGDRPKELTTEPAGDTDLLKTKAFNYLVGQSVAGITPTYADVAIRLGTSEPRARRIVQALIGDGRLAKDGRRYTVPTRQGVA